MSSLALVAPRLHAFIGLAELEPRLPGTYPGNRLAEGAGDTSTPSAPATSSPTGPAPWWWSGSPIAAAVAVADVGQA